MKTKTFIFILLLFFILTSCKKISKDKELPFQRTNYTGNELKINGYYYHLYQDTRNRVYFLYHNGILIEGYSFELSELEKQEEEYKNGVFYNTVKDNKLHWGIFQINSTSIEVAGWKPNPPGHFLSYRYTGEILNDTTFIIYETDGDDTYDITYHFKALSPKPDSTNSFIK